ncbi:MAG TPA: DUF5654 family protein [Ktedonobacterales bacterium]
MSDDVQAHTQAQVQTQTQVADQRWHLGLPQGIDKVLDAAGLERVLKAQAAARAQAAAATTVVIGTIVTLVTSAFGFVAALAWNQAINTFITDTVKVTWKINATLLAVLQALAVTIIAVIAVVIIQRVAGRWAKNTAIGGK